MSTTVSAAKALNSDWWHEEYGFFGPFYFMGDHSLAGYLAERELSVVQRTAEEVEGLIHLLQLREKDHVLDLPCGYGRHSIGLAAKGLDVLGGDVNRHFLRIAADHATRADVPVTFRQLDMRQLEDSSRFDAVINMCYSFGFFDSDEENLDVLRRFCRALKPGGRFVMHTDVNLSRVRAGKYKFDEVRQLESGGTLTVIDRYDPSTKRMDGAWLIQENGSTPIRKDYSVRVYEKDEFIDLCLQAGFSACVAYSSWTGTPWSEDAEEIMFVAKR
jgi:2-polyprenyl-3-methyl-5-hydroxy-6-metoxy-1,4-benzoquinol methylase